MRAILYVVFATIGFSQSLFGYAGVYYYYRGDMQLCVVSAITCLAAIVCTFFIGKIIDGMPRRRRIAARVSP